MSARLDVTCVTCTCPGREVLLAKCGEYVARFDPAPADVYRYAPSDFLPNTRSAPDAGAACSAEMEPVFAVSSRVAKSSGPPVVVVIVSTSVARPPYATIRSTIFSWKVVGTR